MTETGDTLAARDNAADACRRSRSRTRRSRWRSSPLSKGDLDKMGPALQRMLEEEPTARVERSETGEQVLRAIGEAHVAVICERLKRKFGAAIVTRTPTVPYRETIRGTTKVHGRYKKQTGGHGMFGDVWLELEPNPAAGVEFAERGRRRLGARRASSRASRRASARRPPRACSPAIPLIDFKATLYDGSFHPVDSNELSFKIAASMALKDGVLQAKPVLLEPIMTVEIRVPEQYMGEVNRDLNGRRGRVLGMDTADGTQVITAHVPQAELFSYATELRSLTGGRGHVQLRCWTTTRTCPPTSPRRSSRRTGRNSPRATDSASAPPPPFSRPCGASPSARMRSRQVHPVLVEGPTDDRAGAAGGPDGEQVVEGRRCRRTR